jgi:hypothetical protein
MFVLNWTEIISNSISGSITGMFRELFNYALKYGYTIDKIKEVLGIKNPIQIPGIKTATEKLFLKEK